MATPQPLTNNYFDFYQAKADPFEDHHRTLLAKHAPTVSPNWNADASSQEATHQSAVCLLAYLTVSLPEPDQPLVSVLHYLHRHIPLTGMVDAIDVAFMGDFRANNQQPPQVVALPELPFERSGGQGTFCQRH